MKRFVVKLVNIVLVVTALLAYNYKVSGYQKQDEANKAEYIENKKAYNEAMGITADTGYKDGTYEGSGLGYGGNITVEVVIESGQIDEINIIDTGDEDTSYINTAKALISRVIEMQGTEDVDAVTGATLSSYGILDGIDQALEKAKNNE